MQMEIFKFCRFLSGLGAQTSTLERFLASADLSRGENILNIREYINESVGVGNPGFGQDFHGSHDFLIGP